MKNFKKFLSLLLAVAFVLGMTTVVSADREFSDLSASHWGYSYVQTLVGDGTINGYQDGTFRPEANVTRAEFVKMIGKTDVAFEVPFDDINGHWAYDYIMYSNMDVEGTSFNPDVPITRDDVIGLLWKRAGSPTAYAPGVITSQSAKPQAAAWAYAYGIMNGDDGVTMRLTDGVTRAEAAALICRSRTVETSSVKVLTDTVDEKILKNVYEGMTYLGEYDPDRTYTNGEIADFAMQLMYETSTPMFDGANFDYTVKGEHGLAFGAVCNHVWGEERKTEEFYAAKATNLDTLAALLFAAENKTSARYAIDGYNNGYDDVKSVPTEIMKKLINGAHNNGIRLDNTNNIYPNETLTGENLALMLLQLDKRAGFNSAIAVGFEVSIPIDQSVRTNILTYPNNSDKFPFVMQDIPNVVYESDFIDVDGSVCTSSPKDDFRFFRDNSDLFVFYIQQLQYDWLNNGAYTSVTFYPSMICESDNGYIFKVRINVSAYDSSVTFDQMFPNITTDEKPDFTKDSTFFATLATGAKFSGINIPTANAKLTSIDLIE